MKPTKTKKGGNHEKVIWRLIDSAVKTGKPIAPSVEIAKSWNNLKKNFPNDNCPSHNKLMFKKNFPVDADPIYNQFIAVDFTTQFVKKYGISEYDSMHVIGFNSASPSPNETIRYMSRPVCGPGSAYTYTFGPKEVKYDSDPDEHVTDPIFTAGELFTGAARSYRHPVQEPMVMSWEKPSTKPVNRLLVKKKMRVQRKPKPGLDAQPVYAKRDSHKIGMRGKSGCVGHVIDTSNVPITHWPSKKPLPSKGNGPNTSLPYSFSHEDPPEPDWLSPARTPSPVVTTDSDDDSMSFYVDGPDGDLYYDPFNTDDFYTDGCGLFEPCMGPEASGPAVHAFMAGTVVSNYDARKYPLCAPHDGTKGLAFNTFQNDFLTAIATIDLKDPNENWDLAECLVGVDEGGDVPPPGAIAPIPPGGQAAQRRRAKRLKLSYAHLYKHIADESLQRMLAQYAFNDGREAWRIVFRECFEPVTELELEDLRRNVRTMTILSSVGYSEHSVSKFHRALSDENGKIPDAADRIQEHELCLLVLGGIARASSSLAPGADIELKAAAGQRQLVYPPAHPFAGFRSITAIISHFDPLWRAAVQRGTIPPRAPTSKSGGGARVDGLVAAAVHDEDDDEFGHLELGYEPHDGEVLANVAAALRDKKGSKPTGEVVCWNCKGLGHPKSLCPSERRDRSYTAVISVLSGMVDRDKPASSAPSAPRLTPRPGVRTAPSRSKARFNRGGKSRVSAFLMSDGTFVTPDGEQSWDMPDSEDESSSHEPASVDDAPADDGDLAYANAILTRHEEHANAASTSDGLLVCEGAAATHPEWFAALDLSAAYHQAPLVDELDDDGPHWRGMPELFASEPCGLASPTYAQVATRGLSAQ